MSDDDITFEHVEKLMAMDPGTYKQRVIALFRAGRATQAQWLAMAEAVLSMSMSGDGYLVASIDRAVLGKTQP